MMGRKEIQPGLSTVPQPLSEKPPRPYGGQRLQYVVSRPCRIHPRVEEDQYPVLLIRAQKEEIRDRSGYEYPQPQN